jgi:hypothetical protein
MAKPPGRASGSRWRFMRALLLALLSLAATLRVARLALCGWRRLVQVVASADEVSEAQQPALVEARVERA